MGFFDSLISAGKAAANAAGDAMTQKTLEQWEKISRAPKDRVLDLYEQNNKEESKNTAKRALAIAALQSRELFNKDLEAQRLLIRLREKISLESSSQAKSLMRAIDNLRN